MPVPTKTSSDAHPAPPPRRRRRRFRSEVIIAVLLVLAGVWVVEQLGAVPPLSALLNLGHLQHPRRFAQLLCFGIVLIGAVVALKPPSHRSS
jgi:hypothetical protein